LIKGLAPESEEEARRLLERFGNSVLFQLDLLMNARMYLSEERSIAPRITPRLDRDEPVIRRVEHEYDAEPMALYWYARSARQMPLLQYLAFYQALEFYFPFYAQREAQDMIRDRLKNPTFSAERDKDIDGLITAIRITGAGGRGFGDERSQLRATVTRCVTAEELRAFILKRDGMKEFLKVKKSTAPTTKSVNLDNPTADIRSDVAERIYEIRCRIVHTKSSSDDDPPLLLPFSKEARSMHYDLELIEYIVREVLIAASRPLRLPARV
jgi:hypothetical protein